METGSTESGVSTSITGIVPPSSTTPEDLLAMYDQEEKGKTEEVNKEVEKQAKVKESLPKQEKAKEIVKGLEKKEETAVQSGKPSESQDKTVLEKPKAFTAKLGDKTDVEIPEEAEITQSLGDKAVSFKVKDAVKAYLGQEDFNRKMMSRVNTVKQKETEITGRERAYKQELAGIKQRAQDVVRLALQGDPIRGVSALARMASANNEVDAIMIERQLIESLTKTYEIWDKWTPEQRDGFFAQRRAEESERQAKDAMAQVEYTKAEQAVRVETQAIKDKHGITDDQIVAILDVMNESLVGEGKRFKTVHDIKPADVADFHLAALHLGNVKQAIEKVSPELLNDEGFVEEVFNRTKGDPDFADIDTLSEVIKTSLEIPSKSVENLNRRVELNKSGTLNSQLRQVSSQVEGKESEADKELYDEFFRSAQKREANIKRLARR
jgi:hypothetical protein